MVALSTRPYDNEEVAIAEIADTCQLTNCPGCDYDLRGNLAASRCSECGLEWDVGAMCFRPSQTRQRLATVGVLLALASLSWVWWNTALRGFPPWPPYGGLVITIALVWPALFLYRHFWKYRFACQFQVMGAKKIH